MSRRYWQTLSLHWASFLWLFFSSPLQFVKFSIFIKINIYSFTCGSDPSGCFAFHFWALVLLSVFLLDILMGLWLLSSVQLKDPQSVMRLIGMWMHSANSCDVDMISGVCGEGGSISGMRFLLVHSVQNCWCPFSLSTIICYLHFEGQLK